MKRSRNQKVINMTKQRRSKMLQEICQKEYFGLNPERPWSFTDKLHRTHPYLADAIMGMGQGSTFFYFPSQPEDVAKQYKKDAKQYSEEKLWSDTRAFGIHELREMKGSSELTDYLKETAGNIKLKVTPSKSDYVAPEGGKICFRTGGIIGHWVEINFNFTFYGEDENKSRAYFGLSPGLINSWSHVQAASDHNEQIYVGIQLERDFDLKLNSYLVKHLDFPVEQIRYGQTYPVVPIKKIEELVKSNQSQKEKDRIFRAIVELGYVY